MPAQHSDLAASGRWGAMSLAAQLGNVGSEVSRALKWRDKNQKLFDGAVIRALELMDFTIQDSRWRHRLKELTRARELLCDAWLGGKEYSSDFEGLNRYFFHFALAARK
ncbi:MAG TPA: hypothetical protein VNH15_04890 [Elusimicrobiota bacterium]|jgi:hypothetical protein|nr:hypothetical protein [Elusimicrobiota bacterium]